MRRLALLLLLLLITATPLAGCTERIVRSDFNKLYRQTSLNEQALSVVPKHIDHDDPPTVVNWWYAGTHKDDHQIVSRRLTWDREGNPKGEQQRYKINRADLKIDEEFDTTSDSTRWLPLHEASSEVQPPADLPTVRSGPAPAGKKPARLRDPRNPEPFKPNKP